MRSTHSGQRARCPLQYQHDLQSVYSVHGRTRRAKGWPSGGVGQTLLPSNSSMDIDTNIRLFGYLQDFSEKYVLGKLLGAGTFGVVHTCVDRATGERYAVKTIHKKFFCDSLEYHFVNRVQHEVDIYDRLGGSLNVAHLYGAYEDEVSVDLVMELCTGGELYSRIQQGRYGERQAACIIRDVLRAVAQAHARGVVLRDVKPENFLFLNTAEDAPLKMVDFGLADYCRPGQYLTARAGTPYYVAPEVLRQRYSLGVDVWSSGVLAYQLLTGRFPWDLEPQDSGSGSFGQQPHVSNKTIFRAILYQSIDFSGPPWDSLSPGAREVVKAMLTRDPEARPSAEELLDHPWLREEGQEDRDHLLDDTLVQRLQRFGTYGRLKRAALRAMAPFIAEDDQIVAHLRGMFASLDRDKKGTVSYEDLVEALQQGKYDLADVEVRQLVQQFDLNQDGQVDYNEWLTALVDWKDVQNSEEWSQWVMKVFKAFDHNGSGRITAEELEDMLCGGMECVPDTVGAAMREADMNEDGGISFDEFAKLLHMSKMDKLELFDSRRHRTSGGGFAQR